MGLGGIKERKNRYRDGEGRNKTNSNEIIEEMLVRLINAGLPCQHRRPLISMSVGLTVVGYFPTLTKCPG